MAENTGESKHEEDTGSFPGCLIRWTPTGAAHTKPHLLGHWGTTQGPNFIYVHLNLNVINITGPGHGEPGFVANAYLDGTDSEMYPNFSQDEDGLLSSRVSGVYQGSRDYSGFMEREEEYETI